MNEAVVNTLEHGWHSLVAASVAIFASLILGWLASRLVRAVCRSAPSLESYLVLLPARTIVFGLASCSSNLPLLQIAYVFVHGLGGHWGIISTALTLTIIGTWLFSRLLLGLYSRATSRTHGFGIARSIFIASIWLSFSAGRMTGAGSRIAIDSFKSILQLEPECAIDAAFAGLVLSLALDILFGLVIFLLNRNDEKRIGEQAESTVPLTAAQTRLPTSG